MTVQSVAPVRRPVPAIDARVDGPRLRPVPLTEPPPLSSTAVNAVAPGQEPLELGWESSHRGATDDAAGEGLPDPRRAAATLAVAVVEVLNGARPAGQLVRWTSQDVHAALARRAAVNTRITGRQAPGGRSPIVRAVRVCRPCPEVAETSAVVVSPDRVRALAIRLEGNEGRWRATALEIG